MAKGKRKGKGKKRSPMFWVGCIGGILGFLFLLCGGFLVGIATIVSGAIKSAGAYEEALEKARTNPAVIAALGEPIEDGWMPEGQVNNSGTSGNANLSISISGPNGSGTIYVVARKVNNRWVYDVLEVSLYATDEVVDLMPDDSTNPKDAPDTGVTPPAPGPTPAPAPAPWRPPAQSPVAPGPNSGPPPNPK